MSILDLAQAVRDGQYRWERSEDGSYCVLRGAVYCEKPEKVYYNDGEGLYQSMILCVPAAYLHEDGTVNPEGQANGYTAKNAPVIFKNNCQGWFSSVPTFERDDCCTTYKDYVNEGFVYVGCGARSRNLTEGKAPAPVVDLKAGIRYLRLNAAAIPGDCSRIIAVGGSGAGEMSSVIGASGNMDAYYPYLYEIGAAGIEKSGDGYVSTIRDDVYGCMSFYPIADIENSDMAYAWMRFDTGETSIRRHFPPELRGTELKFTPFQKELQNDLAVAFCEYVNGFGFADEKGDSLSFYVSPETGRPDPRRGSYYEKTLQNLSDALNKFLVQQPDAEAYVLENYGVENEKGRTLPGWIRSNGDGTYSVTDLKGFLQGTKLRRIKNIPGFDTLDKSAENNAFGTRAEQAVHFSASVAAVLKANYGKYAQMEGFDQAQVEAYMQEAFRPDIVEQTYLMNGMHILLDRAKGLRQADVAPLWRIRMGTADPHTSFPIGYNIGLEAQRNGAAVDYSLVWNMVHGSEIEGTSAGTFIQWVHSICTP